LECFASEVDEFLTSHTEIYLCAKIHATQEQHYVVR